MAKKNKPLSECSNSHNFPQLSPTKVIKRFNVEKNDFPEGLPMCRGTPTFVVYRDGKPTKWDEFKPADFVKKNRRVDALWPGDECKTRNFARKKFC